MDLTRRTFISLPMLLAASSPLRSLAESAGRAGDGEARWIALSGSPIGISWSMDFGFWTGKPATFLPELRKVGGGFSKIYLFWSQIEPARGQYDWTAVDAYVDQLQSPEEGLIAVFSSSLWATERSAERLPPSPAKDLDAYYKFVHALVSRCAGKVRYWQNDAEPNDPLYWNGTKEQFAAQLAVFYRAVKSADPSAVVVIGGYDGIFFPADTGLPPIPGQEKNLAFFEYVLQVSQQHFDIFDLRLYINAYTIPARVAYMRDMMRRHGYLKPIICTEYDGPIFSEIKGNGQYLSWLLEAARALQERGERRDAPGAIDVVRDRVLELYAKMNALPPQTRMYMQGAPKELDERLMRMQVRDTVIRNVIALSAGVQKMVYWNLANDANAPDEVDPGSIWNLMYGKLSFAEYTQGQFIEREIFAQGFRRMSEYLHGVTFVHPVREQQDTRIHVFRATRARRADLMIAWHERDPYTGEDEPPVDVEIQWNAPGARIVDALGNLMPSQTLAKRLRIQLSGTPIYIERTG